MGSQRRRSGHVRATLDRRIVAVDPAPTSETGSDEWGIIVEG
jgi:phage terminase large subunit-like protein